MRKLRLRVRLNFFLVLIGHDWKANPVSTPCDETPGAISPYQPTDTFFTPWWATPPVSAGVHFVIFLDVAAKKVCDQTRNQVGARALGRSPNPMSDVMADEEINTGIQLG